MATAANKGPGAVGGVGSSSAGGNSNAGNTRASIDRNRSTNLSRAHVQQASSSAATFSLHRQQQASMVPPYHLQVLKAAGVPSLRLKDAEDHTNSPDMIIDSGMVPLAGIVLQTLLPELRDYLKLQDETAAAAAQVATANSSNSHSSTTNGSTAASSNTTGSSTGSSSASGDTAAAAAAAAAAVLALLDPCSLMLGEVLALFAGADSATARLPEFTSTVEHMWHNSLEISMQQA